MASQKIYIDDLLADPKLADWVTQPTEELVVYWENWLKNQPERALDLEEAKRFLRSLAFVEEPMSDKVKAFLLEDVEASITPEKRLGPKVWMGVAASIALIIATFLLVDWTPRDFAVPYGAIEEIQLPDGSEVTLNANSKLHFERGWEEASVREVWLEGEAFFKVNPTPSLGAPKFIVHTNRGDVAVLGTTFNIKDRDDHFSVILTEGSVVLTLAEDAALDSRELQMKPGDMLSLDVANKTHHWTKPNTEVYTSWTAKKLTCDNTPIAYLAEVIEEQYGYEVIIQDEALANRKLSGTLNNPSLEDLIQAISLSFNIKVEKTADRQLIISY